MGERLLCKQEVIGSIPFTSTRAEIREIRDRRSSLRDAPDLCDLIAAGDVRRRPGLVPGRPGEHDLRPHVLRGVRRGSGAGVD